MLSFFRRIINSKVGLIVTFAVLIVIALAFAAGDVTGLGHSGTGAMTPTSVAEVGGTNIASAALKSNVQREMETYRQQQPTLDMASFVNQGGFEGTMDRLINGLALEKFAELQGMRVSKKSIDGQIASIPGLLGADGKFDPAVYQRILADRKLTDASVRADMKQGTLAQQLISPTVGANQVPMQIALPYASLLLEKRDGMIALIPSRAIGAGTPPTDSEIATFYKRNIAQYTVPERRVTRYAMVSPEQVKAAATPTEAEIAQAYQSQKSRFTATEKRTLKQVIMADQAAATALAAKVKGGTSIDDAARAAGLEASTISDVEKANYATQSSTEAADAAFSAASGAVIGPVKTPLGWAVARIEKVTQVPGKSLAEARETLAKEVGIEKANEALGKVHDAIDDAVADGATFDELISDQKLTGQTTAPLIANGTNPDDAAAKPDPQLTQVIAAGFNAEEGDSPQMVPIGQDGSFAVVALQRIVPAAPRPLAQIREGVVRDFSIDRARRAARKVAADVVAKVNKGTSLKQALAETKLKTPPAQTLNASRAQLAANPRGAPPPLALMFSMAEKRAKLLEAPNDGGWFVVYLDKIERGDAKGNDAIIKATRVDLGRVIGVEYSQQFTEAVRRQLGVEKNAKAIAAVRSDLLGQAGEQP